jgi:hypothetical protein
MLFDYTIVLLATITTASALGINCRGSSDCNIANDLHTASRLAGFISGIDPNRWYNNGEQIACAQSTGSLGVASGFVAICAFLQNTGGAPGRNIAGLAPFITGHGCTICGSVPYFYPSDNNVADGELTFNGVHNPCTDNGLC